MIGRDAPAVALAGGADQRLLTPADRAEVAFVRASATIRGLGRPLDSLPDLLGTIRELAPAHPALAMRLVPLATYAAWQGWDHAAQLDIARISATIDVDHLGEVSRRLAASVAGFAAMLDGDRATGHRLLGDTVAWGRTVDDAQQAIWAGWAALWLGDEDSFDTLLRRAAALARTRGEIGALTEALGAHALQVALLAQRYDEASIAAHEAITLAGDLRADTLTLLPRSALTIIAAVRGDDDDALRHGDEVLRVAERTGHFFRAAPTVYGLALLDMVAARWDDALDRLAQLRDTNDPALAIAAPEIVEAAVRAGRPDQAHVAFRLHETRVEQSGNAALMPRLATCRALLASDDEAAVLFQRAAELTEHARPFDRPRIHLLVGEHLRRRGRRLEAREHLRSAIDGFARVDAKRWAERARVELRATGETARRRTPDAVTQLTPQELQIAEAGRRRPHQQGRGDAALPVTAHRRRPPSRRVRQARHHVAARAPDRAPGHGLIDPRTAR